MFAHSDLDLGKTSLIKHHTELNDMMPFKGQISLHIYHDVKAHLQDMLDISNIQRSYRPWASTVVLVHKMHGCLKFCIDLRKLNNQTVKNAYSLPPIDVALNSLQGSQWFSFL